MSIYNTHDQAKAFKGAFNTFALNVHSFLKNINIPIYYIRRVYQYILRDNNLKKYIDFG